VITRIITGTVLAVVALSVIVHGGWVFFAVVVLLALIGMSELSRLMKRYRPLPLASFVGVALMCAAAWLYGPLALLGAAGATFLLTAVLGLRWGPRPGVTVRMGVTLFGVLYVGLGFAAILLTRRLDDGMSALLTIVFGTWAGDTMAYFAGRLFGSTPMAPVLSPKKTWEGFAGGVVGTIVTVCFIGLYTPLGALDSLALGAAIAITGPLGDLFESLIKRDAQIKDSGRGIPGHGGVLDRFDALMFASIAGYVVLTAVLGF
jgi:phosphatidate cytidylyltransferase